MTNSGSLRLGICNLDPLWATWHNRHWVTKLHFYRDRHQK